jgi:hypothetical protein
VAFKKQLKQTLKDKRKHCEGKKLSPKTGKINQSKKMEFYRKVKKLRTLKIIQ